MSPKISNQRLFVTLVLLGIVIPYSQAKAVGYEQPAYLEFATGLTAGAVLARSARNDFGNDLIPARGREKLTVVRERQSQVPGTKAHPQPQWIPEDKGLLGVEVPLNSHRIGEILKVTERQRGGPIHVRWTNRNYRITDTLINVTYDAENRILNKEEMFLELQNIKNAGGKVSGVTMKSPENHLAYTFAAPAVPRDPKIVKLAGKLHRGFAALAVIPALAAATDAAADARDVPHSRKGYVADKVEKGWDWVTAKFQGNTKEAAETKSPVQ